MCLICKTGLVQHTRSDLVLKEMTLHGHLFRAIRDLLTGAVKVHRKSLTDFPTENNEIVKLVLVE